MLKNNKVKAIGLLSGGLDSTLAARILMQQDIEVVGISFITPFFSSKRAKKATGILGIELIEKNITDEHLEIVKNPPHGYGKMMNPCIDCHALMLSIAGKIMEKQGFDFIFTGEVLGERPMSQNRVSLDIVAKASGYKGHILRPLSAKLLKQTDPEIKGLVDRNRLLDLQGRSRKRQFELAEEFKIAEYPNPAGGCLLTDKSFSNRLRELFSKDKNPGLRDIKLLTVGRHFRLSDSTKLVVGRDEHENQLLEQFFSAEDFLVEVEDIPGPLCLLVGDNLSGLMQKVAQICASYSDADDGIECSVLIRNTEKTEKIKAVVDKKNRTALRIN